MEWKQIQTKWAAMTRRIRADYTSDRIGGQFRSTQDSTYRQDLAATMADSVANSGQRPDIKNSDLKTAVK
jgi:hypothetical protein